VKNVLRISLCLLLFICASQIKSVVISKSQFHKFDLVSSSQHHGQSGDDAVFAEDTDDDAEIGLPGLQYAETLNDIRYSYFISGVTSNFQDKYPSHHSPLIILHRTLRL
jgi:hypothetical protein